MRVAVDMISAGSGFAPAAGGMTTYYEGLLAELPDADGIEAMTAFLPPHADHVDPVERNGLRLVRCRRLPRRRALRVAYEHFEFPRIVASEDVDVLLSTHNIKPLRWNGPSVVVLQSMQYFFLPDPIGIARRAYLRAALPRSLAGANRVIAVSEAARHDAIGLFGLDPSRVVAVHHGCSMWATEAAARFARAGRPPPPPPLDPGRPYVVMVSSLYRFKNHARLIEAFGAIASNDRPPHDLVIVGREADVTIAELQEVARRSGVADRVRFLGPYPAEHLPALLANASAIAYPSLYETFGHPVLEAYAFERPLLTSNVGGAAEVAGEGAVTVDPYDVESIAAGLADVLNDEMLRRRLIDAGRGRLADFSWAKCARRTAATLREAIEDARR
jgi:glycosyltransferase involved in cell wall biosynthesis